MEDKYEGNQNKIILGDFNSTLDKMDRYGWKLNTKALQMLFKFFPVKTYCGQWARGSMEKGEPRIL